MKTTYSAGSLGPTGPGELGIAVDAPTSKEPSTATSSLRRRGPHQPVQQPDDDDGHVANADEFKKRNTSFRHNLRLLVLRASVWVRGGGGGGETTILIC